ncbi:Uncharacterised protein [Alloiococcus otitis]|uniref:ArpU family phage transcriptional regulator n=1 Tax=Alloiococcus otitis ATCC 51267 TaxID=883081 RepID=K9E6R5_9LACT|nr:hypothetical protein [Alloiococcus otitis]EKU92849.1 hypothetical protein HMPREF9698_01602 [Alloiococcus otitis ATCC 51267]SUU80687.1 Uncharacterised protein [Alloiococcus otitis]SUU91685.1 Uncharacterised protein [Alloiococcus otitis]
MTPKEYFQECLKLDNKVTEKQNQLDLIKASFTSAVKMKDINVQTSGGNSHEERLAKLFELNDEINADVDKLVNYKLKLSLEVNQLEDDRYRMILSERYFQGKKFELIAVERDYDIRWIYKLHGQALQAFGDKFPEKF